MRHDPGPLQALVFDCDGVLVDTERDGHRVAFNRAFAAAGLDVDWGVERYGELLSTGGGKERMRRHFDETGWPATEAGRDRLIADLHRSKTDIFMSLIGSGSLPLRPGVARLVDEAQAAEVPVAICSTSNERAVGAVANALLGPERARKMRIFAGDVVPRKKPDPAIYDLAAGELGFEPDRCVVIEDSHIGLAAAKAAGMNCVVTVSAYTVGEDFDLADLVVADLDQGVDLARCGELAAMRR